MAKISMMNKFIDQQNLMSKLQILIHSKGRYVFRFDHKEDMTTILTIGPWMVGTRLLILNLWFPHFNFDQELMCKVAQVNLPNLDLHFQFTRGLSKVACVIGIPLSEKISYAQVLSKVYVSINLPFYDPLGHMFQQLVHYECKPYFCKKFKLFGHTDRGHL